MEDRSYSPRKESAYAFRMELDEVHKRNRRNPGLAPLAGEIVIDDSWSIRYDPDAGDLLEYAAKDLQDYFHKSMGVDVRLQGKEKEKVIRLSVETAPGKKPRSFHVEITGTGIKITGNDLPGVAQGCYYLEDTMNLREAPFLPVGSQWHETLFTPRMVHSGWGLDQYPDSHLNAIAHAGFDSILLFVSAPGKTTHGFMDFNNLIDRCEKFGLGVYFYSYLPSYKYPDEPDAEAFFDQSFGSVFRHSPKAKGLILVGESCAFPSKDERTNGRPNPCNIGDAAKKGGVTTEQDFKASIDSRPNPGHFPCRDYPQWLTAVKKAVHKYAPEAEIVFWTYNWGSAPKEARLELIRNIPQDVILMATFEMYEHHTKYPNHKMIQTDYSITFPGPGFYFRSEAEAARERDLKLYAMTNSAGRTWDFGVSPYVPTPFQWIKRFKAMSDASKEWGLGGLMDSHHFGWFPSEINECARLYFRTPQMPPEEILRRIAERDFGPEAAQDALRGWQLWSDAIDSYTPGYEDLAGPLRVGPSYPFVFHPLLFPITKQTIDYPTTPQGAGVRWIHPFYQPEQVRGMSNCGRRVVEDIKIMGKALELWEEGTSIMRKMLEKVPAEKRANAEKIVGVGEFCGRTIRTMVHIKKWWILNKKLEIEYDADNANSLLDEMLALIAAEKENVLGTIPLTDGDSRLGWEPSMDYVGSTWHLQWKLYQLENLIDTVIPAYRESVALPDHASK